MFHPDNFGSSDPLWLGDWKYQIGSSNTHVLGVGMNFQAKE
jgi:hypothetical protein